MIVKVYCSIINHKSNMLRLIRLTIQLIILLLIEVLIKNLKLALLNLQVGHEMCCLQLKLLLIF